MTKTPSFNSFVSTLLEERFIDVDRLRTLETDAAAAFDELARKAGIFLQSAAALKPPMASSLAHEESNATRLEEALVALRALEAKDMG